MFLGAFCQVTEYYIIFWSLTLNATDYKPKAGLDGLAELHREKFILILTEYGM